MKKIWVANKRRFVMYTINGELCHHGVKGMKWGVRRYQPYPSGSYYKNKTAPKILKSRDGKVTLNKQKMGVIGKILRRISPKLAKAQDRYRGYDILDKNGKHVGDFQVEDNPDHLYINWISVSGKERGKGYASSALNTIIDDAKRMGHKKIKLEVPAISPDAKHIYEKAGFKDTGKKLGDDDDIWGGLTEMELDLTKRRKS